MMNLHGAKHPGLGRRLKRALCVFGAFAALFGSDVARGASSENVGGADYRPASTVPEAWRKFAGRLQSSFQERLAAGDVRPFQDYLTKRAAETGAGPVALLVRTWILPDGKVERIEFDGLDDGDVEVGLRAILASAEVGAPPPDMLQPLHLRLSLRPNDEQEK